MFGSGPLRMYGGGGVYLVLYEGVFVGKDSVVIIQLVFVCVFCVNVKPFNCV